MSDTFNPHEILSRLRAKPSSSSNNSISIGHGGNSANNNNINNPHQTNTISSSQSGNNNTISNTLSHVTSNTSKNNSSSKTSKAIAASLAITAPQPQRPDNNLSARIELEKELKKLQDEIAILKTENKQLISDKEDVERQFIEYKIKNEDLVTKLRGKIAAMSLAQQQRPVEGHGKIYPQSAHGHKTHNRNMHYAKMYGSPPPPPPPLGPTLTHSSQQQQPQWQSPEVPPLTGSKGFREPTFSELMRRSTTEFSDFQDSLRRSAGSKTALVPKTTPSNNLSSSRNFGYGSYDSMGMMAPMPNIMSNDQYEYYPPPSIPNINSGMPMNMNMNVPVGMNGNVSQGGANAPYGHQSMLNDFMPEFDHSLAVVEIDLSKQ
eukprot:scaffold156_cov173-Ochromonas_danica.AAC.18